MKLRKSRLSAEEILSRYTEGVQIQLIALEAGISRVAVHNVLTASDRYDARRGTVRVTCAFCGETFELFRFKVKDVNYCSRQCFHAHRSVCGEYSRIGSTMTKVGGKESVHYINGDQTDKRPENVRVFDSHNEHMRFHHEERGKRL